MIDILANLLNSIVDLLGATWAVLLSILALVVNPPVLPLLAWGAFWLFAVDWDRLRELLLKKGGCVATILIGVVMVLVWGVVAPPDQGFHNLLGLHVSNFVGKAVFVASLFCMAIACGALQLKGCCSSLCPFRQCDKDSATPESSSV